MGLDMYLNRKTYIRGFDNNDDKNFKITISYGGKAFKAIDTKNIKTITEEVGYWRKANEIHAWFVDNVQDGEDNCHEYDVSVEALQHLLDDVNTVLEDHDLAEQTLPTLPGFFFGSTEYDEYYWQDLEETKKILEKVLEDDKKFPEGILRWYTYRSSW